MDKNIDYQLDAVSDEVASSFSMVNKKGGTVLGSTMRDMAGSIATIPILPPDPEIPGDYLLADKVSGGSAAVSWQHMAAIAVTGNYNDLINKPEIPEPANNGVLTIEGNGTVLGTFSANASADEVIDITVPNPANNGVLTIESNGIALGTFSADASADEVIDITVPTSVSQLDNDTGFQTWDDVASTVAEASSALADSISLKQDLLSVVSGGRLELSPESVLSFNESGLASESYVDASVDAASAALSERIDTKQDTLLPVPGGGILISGGSSILVDPDFFSPADYVTVSQFSGALDLKQDRLSVNGGRLELSPESVLSFNESGLASESYVDSSVDAASAALSTRINSKQDIMTAGTGIVINGGTVISAAAATSQAAGIVRPDNSTVYLNESGDLAADTLPRYPGSNTELGMLYAEPGSAAQWIPSPDLKDPGKPFFGYFRIMTSRGGTVEVPNISALAGLTDAKIGDIVNVDDIGLSYRRGVPFVRTELSDQQPDRDRFPEAPGWSLFETMTLRDAEDLIHTSGFGQDGNDPKGAMMVYDPEATPLLGSEFHGAWRVTAPEALGLKPHYDKLKFFFPSIVNNQFSWEIRDCGSLESLHVFRNGLLLLDGNDEDYTYTESGGVITISFTASAGLTNGDKYLAEAWYY